MSGFWKTANFFYFSSMIPNNYSFEIHQARRTQIGVPIIVGDYRKVKNLNREKGGDLLGILYFDVHTMQYTGMEYGVSVSLASKV
jgi:hypothetical protein